MENEAIQNVSLFALFVVAEFLTVASSCCPIHHRLRDLIREKQMRRVADEFGNWSRLTL